MASWGFDAVLFDFDGTLADSYEAIAASVNEVRRQRGLDALTTDAVKRHVGHGPELLLEATVPGTDLAVDLPRYRAHHPTVMRPLTRLLPGAAETLAALAGAGMRLALCSNKPRLFSAELLEHLGVASRFVAVLGPEDVARPKPAPDMVLAALARLDVPAARALYVGDMTVDIATARAAGVPVWIVPTGSDPVSKLREARPDRLLDDLFDLVRAVA